MNNKSNNKTVDTSEEKVSLINYYTSHSAFDISKHTKDQALINFYKTTQQSNKILIEMYFELLQEMMNGISDNISFEYSSGNEYTFGIKLNLKDNKISLSKGVEN